MQAGFVNRDHQWVYVRNPKVGYTSTLVAMMRDRYPDAPQRLEPLKARMKNEGDLVDGAGILQLVQAGFLAFTCVRDPWAKLVSVYTGHLLPNPYRPPQNLIDTDPRFEPEMSFADFVRVVADTTDATCEFHLRSQCRSLLHRGALLPTLIGRMEQFDAYWDRVSKLTGMAPRPLRENTTKHAPFQDYYDPELAALVGQRYQQDVGLFGYKTPR